LTANHLTDTDKQNSRPTGKYRQTQYKSEKAGLYLSNFLPINAALDTRKAGARPTCSLGDIFVFRDPSLSLALGPICGVTILSVYIRIPSYKQLVTEKISISVAPELGTRNPPSRQKHAWNKHCIS